MPFYEYECSSCKHHVEVLQKISDTPPRKCPDCGRQTLKRLISAPVFRLKGGGWYETDFKSDKEQKRNIAGREDSGESKAEEAKPASSSDAAKPESKTAESKPAEKKAETPSASRSESKGSKSTAKNSARSKPAKSTVKSTPKSTPKRKVSRR